MNSKLLVKHREMTEDEIYAQEIRMTQLEPLTVEDDETEESENENKQSSSEDELEDKRSEDDDDGASNKDEEFEKAFSSGEDD
jgi:RNA polymerase II-associated factor 1